MTKIIVHVNRLKNQSLWNPRKNQKVHRKPPKQKTKRPDSSESEEEEISVGPFPLMTADNPTAVNESTTPQNPALDTPTRTDELWTPLIRVKTILAIIL